MIESLENRVLFTASLNAATGLLTVNGLPGAANDNILVDQVAIAGNQFVQVRHFNHIVAGQPERQLFLASRVRSIVMNGFAGNDQLRLSPVLNKPATIFGGDGNDVLIGGAAGDRLIGGNGNDLMLGNGGNDLFDGGLGADQHIGGAGTDTATYASRVLSVFVNIDNLANDGQIGEGDNVRTDVENVVGGRANDSLIGSVFNNVLTGGLGNDRIIGRAGADTLNGNDGNDYLDARDGASTDKGDGGAGVDTLLVDSLFERLQFANVP